MEKRYRGDSYVSDNELQLMVQIIECLGGLFGIRPTMMPYMPDLNRHLFLRVMRRADAQHARDDLAINRDWIASYTRRKIDGEVGFYFDEDQKRNWNKASPPRISAGAVEEILNLSLRAPKGIWLHPQTVREIQAIAISEGLSLRDVEKLFEWDIFPGSDREQVALEKYVETAANRYADEGSPDSYYKEVAQTYTEILARRGGDLQRAAWQVAELHQLVFIGLRAGGHILKHSPVLVQSAAYEGQGRRNYDQDDLTKEMAHDLGNIPHYQAYAKLITQEGNRQVMKHHVVETFPHEKEVDFLYTDGDVVIETARRIDTAHKATYQSRDTRPRILINEEIHQRRTAWRGEKRGDGSPDKTKPVSDFT